MARRHDALIAVPDAGQYAGQLVNGAVTIAKRHPVKVSLNFVGLALLFLVPGFSITERDRTEAISLLPNEKLMMKESRALVAYEDARVEYEQSRGWFWSCDETCKPLRERSRSLEAKWKAAKAEVEDSVRASKARLGLFSTEGVGMARDAFWRAFAGGTAYAKRATLWDGIFYGIRWGLRRDESLVEFALTMLFRLLSNLTVGIVSGVVTFWFAAVGVVREFGYGLLSPKGLLFFAASLLVGASFIFSAIVAMWATASLGVVAVANVAKVAVENGAPGGQGQRRRLHGD